ncbi:hypothetical protein MF672_022400 [Actinomadura sp. ATCC 31491]|uniref:Uncharacterized protein n=1 Tax=Actinomadura luzonensis TaxID=2805427 RepID=A0ABT0FW18_9ACTN|nr:hypothetical protein [Actinomadura luzonensis]MCK2216530.1 hypothetical protein [Actinomadura luzonensis]
MDVLVVPPLADLTTEVVPPAGMALLDLGEHLVRRLADPARLRAAADRHAGGPLTALFGRAAAAILERRAYDDACLRAVGTALGLAADPAVRLAVDGLELTEGSQESSRDVLGAALRCELFAPEIELARRVVAGRRAHVAVDCADQLPAAFALVAALGERVTLCGRYVAEHRGALRRVPELSAVRWGSWSPERVIRPRWYGGSPGPARRRPGGTGEDGPAAGSGRGGVEPVRWIDDDRPLPGDGAAWAGRLDAARAAALPPEALARCRGLTVMVTRADFLGAATGLTGATVDLRRLPAALPPGVPVTAELAVGAPGVTAEAAGESAELLAEGAAGVRLGGVRAYRLGVRTPWTAGALVRLPPAPGHDLARWAEFEAPGTIPPQQVAILVRRWQERLPGLPPGRLAACTVAGPAVPGPPGAAWDPCTEVVAGAGPDGRGPGTFAVNLRSGRSIRLHHLLVVPVSRLAADPHALDGLAEPARRRLTAELAAAGVLR